MSTTVLVAGATGHLGSAIVQELLQRGAAVRALVRIEKADGGDVLRNFVSTGRVEAVVGDLAGNVEDLAGLLDGVDVIVSALQGGEDAIVNGQVKLIRAAELAGVPRMIPSDFSVDLHRLDVGDNLPLDFRKRADQAFAGSSVRPTSVLNGAFMEVATAPFMGIVDFDAATFSYWGDGEQPMDFTAVPDVAKYTAAAALDPDVAGRPVRVAGQVLSMRELHATVQEATGTALELRALGTVDELRAEIERRKATAKDPYEFISLQYQWAMVSGKGKLYPLDNSRYPEITPSTFQQFLADH